MSQIESEHRHSTPSPSPDPRDRLIVALDLPSARQALSLLSRLGPQCRWVKIGMELFYASGASFVRELRSRGYQVFLDLKLHDIPHTVRSAVLALAQLDVQLLTVHTSGGAEMLLAAQEATTAANGPKLLGVTVLTSMDAVQLQQVGVTSEPAQQVLRLGRLANQAGLHGLVSSPLEASLLRQQLGPSLELVTPGIRPAGAALNDQRRTSTPAAALRSGASRIVVGRPITQAADPESVLAGILADLQNPTTA